MNKNQHALLKLAEECNEVAIRALKQIQFGSGEVQIDQQLSNSDRLTLELLDLISAWKRCATLNELRMPTDDAIQSHHEFKDAKVDKYFKLSVSLGQAIE